MNSPSSLSTNTSFDDNVGFNFEHTKEPVKSFVNFKVASIVMLVLSIYTGFIETYNEHCWPNRSFAVNCYLYNVAPWAQFNLICKIRYILPTSLQIYCVQQFSLRINDIFCLVFGYLYLIFVLLFIC